MKREKSCGALVYRYEGDRLMLLLLRHRHGGHWSFPKGHVEGEETEIETALREIREETGLSVSLREGFRHTVEYYPKPGVRKHVVYFLGELPPTQKLSGRRRRSASCTGSNGARQSKRSPLKTTATF